MEKSVVKGKKEIQKLLVDSLHQVVQALGMPKSKKKTERAINKATKRIAEIVADQMKKGLKKIKEVKAKKEETPKAKKAKELKKIKKVKKTKKVSKIKEPDLEIA